MMQNKGTHVQERKIRKCSTALCRSLFVDGLTQMQGLKQKVNGGYFRGLFFNVCK